MSSWKQALWVARHDLLVERRAREALTIVLPFGLAALLSVPLAIGVDLPLISRIGPTVYWSMGMLFGMQIAWRFSLADGPPGGSPLRDLQALLGLSATARFFGRALASALLLLGFMLALGLSTLLFYSPALRLSALLAPLLLLFATGLAMIATFAATLTSGLGGRSELAALVVAPLALPLLVGAAQGTESLAQGGGILPWLLMLTATNIVLAVVGTVAARPLEEAAR